MSNKFEKKYPTPAEARENFKNSLIERILMLTVPKIVENTKGKEAANKDLAEAMRPIMDEYQESEMTRKMLGVKDYEDWDAFFDEVVRSVLKKVQAEKQKIDSEKPNLPKSQVQQ